MASDPFITCLRISPNEKVSTVKKLVLVIPLSMSENNLRVGGLLNMKVVTFQTARHATFNEPTVFVL